MENLSRQSSGRPRFPRSKKYYEYSRTGIDTFFLTTDKSRIFLKVELRPSADWLKAHPQERLVKANGELGPQSLASQEYARLVEKSLSDLLDHIAASPYAGHVIGYMLWAPGRADAGLGGGEGNIGQSDRSKITKSYYSHDFYSSPLLYKNLIGEMLYEQISRLGAPVDVYTLSDLKNPLVQKQYKLYIFLNAYSLSEEDQQNIARVKRDGKTLLWFYAPGYVQSGQSLDVASITKTVYQREPVGSKSQQL